MQQSNDKVVLFEQTPIPKAVAQLAVPTVLSSLVMVLYNLADTFWVGMLNDPIQNAAVTLAAPVLLAFNAVNNLFGVGSSSMMSRSLGKKDYETVYRSAAFGFYCSIFAGLLFSIAYTVFQVPLLKTGFRMVVFSVILMVVVLFFRQGIMGDREFSWDGAYGLLKKIGGKLRGSKARKAGADSK